MISSFPYLCTISPCLILLITYRLPTNYGCSALSQLQHMKTLGKQNKFVAILKQLQTRKGRIEHNSYVIEGRKSIEHLLESGITPQMLVLQEDQYRTTMQNVLKQNEDNVWTDHMKDTYIADSATFQKISQASTPSGYLAAFPLPDSIIYNENFCPPVVKLTKESPMDIILPRGWNWSLGGIILDGLQDPGNVGSLIRSCHAFGVDQVVLIDCADALSHKVIQSAVGSIFNVKILSCQRSQHDLLLESMSKEMLPNIYALVPSGGHDLESIAGSVQNKELPRHGVMFPWLVVGSEGQGISPEVLESCTQKVTIAMPGMNCMSSQMDDNVVHTSGVGSLNAAIAGSIATYILSRVRKMV